MLTMSIRSNIKAFARSLSDLAYQQLPFVEARTVTELAKLAQVEEKKAMHQVFDRPTPFTVNSIRVQTARKGKPVARVFVQDIAARYLEPYETGGLHLMPGSGHTWLNPKDKALLNTYGNLPRNKLRQLTGRRDVFVGKIQFKDGKTVDGVWRRPVRAHGARSVKLKPGGLKLLMRFGDAMPVRERLEFSDRARMVVSRNVRPVFDREMAKALASARLR